MGLQCSVHLGDVREGSEEPDASVGEREIQRPNRGVAGPDECEGDSDISLKDIFEIQVC